MDPFGLACLFFVAVLVAVKLAESRGRQMEREKLEMVCEVLASLAASQGGTMTSDYLAGKYSLVWGRDHETVYARVERCELQ